MPKFNDYKCLLANIAALQIMDDYAAKLDRLTSRNNYTKKIQPFLLAEFTKEELAELIGYFIHEFTTEEDDIVLGMILIDKNHSKKSQLKKEIWDHIFKKHEKELLYLQEKYHLALNAPNLPA